MTDAAQQFGVPDDQSGTGEVFESPNYDASGVGLCLSGGGYKAAAYHLGGLIRLNELGWLRRIDRITSVSGGSITSAYLGAHWQDLTFENGVATNFTQVVVEPLREFLTEVNLDIKEGILGLLLPFRSGADGVAKGYDKHLFKGASLQSLPEPGAGTPEFMLLATNYELNSLWRFSRRYAADYRVGMIDSPTFSLARIVAASSAFPPFFCPLELDMSGHTIKPQAGADRNSGRFLKRALLADGGIYDNMGLEPIWKRFGTLLVSNAGDAINEEEHPSNWAGLLLRIIGLIHRQAENNRQRPLMILAKLGRRKVAYWPLRNHPGQYPHRPTVQPNDDDIRAAQDEDVRLWSLGSKALARLANHGYALADAAMSSYLTASTPAANKLPFKPDGTLS